MEDEDKTREQLLEELRALRTRSQRAEKDCPVSEDVTQRKENEEVARVQDPRLREQWAELDQLYRTAPVGLCLIDRDLRYVRVNERLAAMNGRPAADHLGRTLREVIPDVAPTIEPACRRVIASGEPVIDLDVRGVTDREPGVEGYWLSSFYPVQDESGSVFGLNVVVVEVTEQKRSGQALQEHALHLRALSGRLMEMQEADRRHLARELHDEIGQVLTVIHLQLQLACTKAGQAAQPQLQGCLNTVEGAIAQVRGLSLDLRPSVLDDFGLEAALRWYVNRQAKAAGLADHLDCRLEQERLPAQLETTCFRIAQEALTNVVRHARAREVWVRVEQAGGGLSLTVRDDGVGFDVVGMRQRAAGGASFGLLGMQERAMLVGGQLQVESRRGHGTVVRAELPLPAPGGLGASGPQ